MVRVDISRNIGDQVAEEAEAERETSRAGQARGARQNHAFPFPDHVTLPHAPSPHRSFLALSFLVRIASVPSVFLHPPRQKIVAFLKSERSRTTRLFSRLANTHRPVHAARPMQHGSRRPQTSRWSDSDSGIPSPVYKHSRSVRVSLVPFSSPVTP